jgi:hypothetical protein
MPSPIGPFSQDSRFLLGDHLEAKDIGIEADRPFQIRDREANMTQPSYWCLVLHDGQQYPRKQTESPRGGPDREVHAAPTNHVGCLISAIHDRAARAPHNDRLGGRVLQGHPRTKRRRSDCSSQALARQKPMARSSDSTAIACSRLAPKLSRRACAADSSWRPSPCRRSLGRTTRR